MVYLVSFSKIAQKCKNILEVSKVQSHQKISKAALKREKCFYFWSESAIFRFGKIPAS